MRRKDLLFIFCCMAFLMLCGGTIRGQQGVLLLEHQKHDHDHEHEEGVTCTCGADHHHGAADTAMPNRIKLSVSTRNITQFDITPRRGEASNPNPNFNDTAYILGPADVNVIFGAGESSAISAGLVQWPGTGGTIFRPTDPMTTNPSILLGSSWAKNAVVSFADNYGSVVGELYDVKFYNNNRNQSSGGTVNNDTGWGGPGGGGPIYQYPYPAANIASSNGSHHDRPVRLYGNTMPHVDTRDALRGYYPGFVYTDNNALHDSVWNALACLIGNPTTPNTALDNTAAQMSVYRIDGITGNGTIFSPVKVADPSNTIYDLFGEYSYYVPIYYHLVPYRIPIETFKFDGQEANSLYTSTKDNMAKDDGEELIVRISTTLPDVAAFTTHIDDKNYYRPTTLLLSGTNTFDSIAISDVEWYAAILKSSYVSHHDGYGSFGYNCAHFSGYFSYQRNNYNFAKSYQPSGRYVDAAVRILDNSAVCVTGNISTSGIQNGLPNSLGAPLDKKTSALLILPGMEDLQGRRSNFSLKIGGNAQILHTQDSGSYIVNNPLYDNYLYSDGGLAVGPGPAFPRTQSDTIYLSHGTELWNEVSDLKYNYIHPRGVGTLTSLDLDPAYSMPYTSTNGSVYGVKGLFDPGSTFISTRSVMGMDTTSIIEIGSITNNQDQFHIYSSGMLKNFRGCASACDSLVIGVGGFAPVFSLSNDSMPLYIIHDGDGSGTYCSTGGIHFTDTGVAHLNTAISTAEGSGDLHIQSQGFVKFYGQSLNFALTKENEIKILSDNNVIYVQDSLNFTNADTAHLTVWAKGVADAMRGYSDLSGLIGGAVQIDGSVTTEYTGSKGNGLILFRSEYDDVLVGHDFSFTNSVATPESGELMVQAGQDVRIDSATTLTHDGQRSMLFEAKKTVAFGGDFAATMGANATMENGDLTIKAGYPDFMLTADVTSPLNWGDPSCCTDSYDNRLANRNAMITGGDIWFGGNVNIALTPAFADSVDTYIRASNSIYIDGDFKHSLASTSMYNSGNYVDTTLLFAETGNIEAIDSVGTEVVFTVSENDSMYLLLQAGNVLGNPCGSTFCIDVNEWKGNILFGDNKTFSVNHLGVGPTLLSAARDIENQVGANFNFTYENSALREKDNLLITAGRHIETHAPYNFDYTQAGTDITSNITMQAGHQADGCNFTLCKDIETASNLEYNVSGYPSTGKNNEFSSGGAGWGSILLFDSVTFNYDGKGQILMTALNGNIESDPYLHGGSSGYDGAGNIHKSQLTFNHKGTGITRLEAIDIKLHDKIEYNGSTADQLQNGQFYLAAFDSILTRNLSYNNVTDTGSVFITTDKLKRNMETNAVISCGEYSAGGINQGHIVLGYGADSLNANENDSIVFNFAGNPSLTGANVLIRAGYDGFANNPVTGKVNGNNLFKNHPKDKNKGYGGNITFDYIKADMAQGNHTSGGYMEISTPNGNIWGKDSISYNAWDGDFLIDAGLGSLEDTLRATRWSTFSGSSQGNGHENILNTSVPFACGPDGEWRTGNIMLKGAGVTFNNGVGNMTFRTREGFIDTYDAFTVSDMQGHLLKYAAMDNRTQGAQNNWGDVSERDFRYIPTTNSGSVFFGADDNIMLNYGNSNFNYDNYGKQTGMGYPGDYDVSGSHVLNGFLHTNPYYYTSYEGYIEYLRAATFNVNVDGYMFYRNPGYHRNRASHLLYRGCVGADCSGITGDCVTTSNGARDLTFDYRSINSGGFASVASNYIDLFTKFDYQGGTGTGLHSVPGMGTLHGESVAGYGLYIKSQFNGTGSNYPEKRRATCEGCGVLSSFPMGGGSSRSIPEMTYIGFHDDARIHTHRQKSLLEAPVVEFFGHAELDTETDKGGRTNITLKSDSLIFHDSVIFAGRAIDLKPFTTDATQRANDMRYGVINDKGANRANYSFYGPAIAMEDRGLPVLELGYQRCNEPDRSPNAAPNARSEAGKERTPMVGGDVIVAFKYGYSIPMFNTVVANHARISFISDSLDNMPGGEYVDAFIRTDLLRIRNHVKFYTDPSAPDDRKGKFVMATPAQMDDQMVDPGMYTRHLHMEPGSELSLSGEDSLTVIPTTVVGGYGNIHENVMVKANGILAPGFASLMEGDCQTPYGQGKLTVHNLQMEKDAVLRISISNRNCVPGPDGPIYCTQTDTVVVQDIVYFTDGRVPLVVLPETETIDPGCYLFMVYGDSMGVSQEYVRNFVLEETRYGDYYFGLNFSEPGKVYLCVSTYPLPEIQRWVDLPEVSGITTTPGVGRRHVISNQHFTFTARFAGDPLKVRALGFYSGETRDLDLTGKILADGSYQYTIYQVVEPWTVQIGPDLSTVIVSNDDITGQRVWTYRNTLYINAGVDDVVSIYNMTGVLYRKVDISAGTNKFTLERGIYVVTLKDGTVHKIVIK